ncbi:DUF6325 family protein [Desertimonas flava]|uniref:DUF6325 family protein n=1 Tax=Desertimonas flava TaxID=2064846 RepID=UPI001969A07E|nr:DUF6325 family protein [Desertimonas flava]
MNPTEAPIELAVIEFPGSRFNGEIVPALAELVDAGTVAILDLVLVSKGANGAVAAIEVGELADEETAIFDQLDGEIHGLLSDEDIEMIGDALSLGSTAAVVVWENTWARRLVEAVAGAGGQVVAHDRLDAETVRSSLALLAG